MLFIAGVIAGMLGMGLLSWRARRRDEESRRLEVRLKRLKQEI
jgi:hypothetical protein